MTRQEACAAYAELLCACKDPRGAARSAGDAAGATEGALEAVVNRLNAVLREYDLAVQSARDEDGTPYVGLCNLAADDGLAQLATQYTAHELALFRKILFEGLLNEATPFYADGIVPLIDCINLCHDLHMSSPMAPTEQRLPSSASSATGGCASRAKRARRTGEASRLYRSASAFARADVPCWRGHGPVNVTQIRGRLNEASGSPMHFWRGARCRGSISTRPSAVPCRDACPAPPKRRAPERRALSIKHPRAERQRVAVDSCRPFVSIRLAWRCAGVRWCSMRAGRQRALPRLGPRAVSSSAARASLLYRVHLLGGLAERHDLVLTERAPIWPHGSLRAISPLVNGSRHTEHDWQKVPFLPHCPSPVARVELDTLGSAAGSASLAAAHAGHAVNGLEGATLSSRATTADAGIRVGPPPALLEPSGFPGIVYMYTPSTNTARCPGAKPASTASAREAAARASRSADCRSVLRSRSTCTATPAAAGKSPRRPPRRKPKQACLPAYARTPHLTPIRIPQRSREPINTPPGRQPRSRRGEPPRDVVHFSPARDAPETGQAAPRIATISRLNGAQPLALCDSARRRRARVVWGDEAAEVDGVVSGMRDGFRRDARCFVSAWSAEGARRWGRSVTLSWATPFTAVVARQLAPVGPWGRTGSLRPAALRLAGTAERGVADVRVGALEGTRAVARVKILHFSDIHFHTPSLAGRVPRLKEVLGYANLYLTKRRASFQAPAAAGALLSLALQLQPDVLVFSGDLTSTGTRAEFELAKKHLAPLRNLPRAASDALASADASDTVPLIMIPGNHDRYTYKNFYEMERHFAREMLGGGPNTPLRYQYARNPNDSSGRNGNGAADEATSSGWGHARATGEHPGARCAASHCHRTLSGAGGGRAAPVYAVRPQPDGCRRPLPGAAEASAIGVLVRPPSPRLRGTRRGDAVLAHQLRHQWPAGGGQRAGDRCRADVGHGRVSNRPRPATRFVVAARDVPADAPDIIRWRRQPFLPSPPRAFHSASTRPDACLAPASSSPLQQKVRYLLVTHKSDGRRGRHAQQVGGHPAIQAAKAMQHHNGPQRSGHVAVQPLVGAMLLHARSRHLEWVSGDRGNDFGQGGGDQVLPNGQRRAAQPVAVALARTCGCLIRRPSSGCLGSAAPSM
eukprot:ctg_808.g277